MFLICDQTDTIQDIATEKANLSRGFSFAGYKFYENVDVKNAFIGDRYIHGVLIVNEANKQQRELRAQREALVSSKTRQIAIEVLKQEGKLPPDYE